MGGGKLVSRVAVAASAQPGGSGCLVLLGDEASGDKFLVDIGAVFSVLPYSSSEPQSGPGITTADASPIPCWGWKERQLQAGGICFSWHFLQAKVAFPILGADFLDRHRLIRRQGGFIQLVAPAGSSSFSKCGILTAAVLVAEPDSSAVHLS